MKTLAKNHMNYMLFSAIIALLFSFRLDAQVTKRIYLVGNSVTDCINYDGFANMALSRGNTHIWGRKIILGSPLILLWNDSTSTNGFLTAPYYNYVNAFDNYTWDCISLQPFDRGITGSDGDLAMVTNFMKRAKRHNPDVQFYIYSRYPRKPDSTASKFPGFTADLWNQLWLGTYAGTYQNNETRKFFEDLRTAVVGAKVGMKDPCIVPVGEVMYEFNKKLAANHLPGSGLTSAWKLYQDGIHANGIGSFLIGSTFYATMYKEDPRGLTVPFNYGTISDAVRDTILQTVYEVVFQKYPLSGTSMSDLVSTNSVSLNRSTDTINILQSVQLTATVKPNNAANKKVTWSSANTDVAVVDAQGVVTGIDNGKTNIIVSTNDGGYTDTCEVTVIGSLTGTPLTGTLAAWDFTGNTGSTAIDSLSAQNHLSGISTTTPSLMSHVGSGLSASGYIGNGMYATNQTTSALSTSIAGNEYFSFKISPENSKLITVTNISYHALSQNVRRYFALFSSIKGFSADKVIHIDSCDWTSSISVPITGHKNISEPVEFRIYVYSSKTIGPSSYEAVGFGNQTGDDFTINGSVLTLSDNEAPSVPANLVASQITEHTMHLAWAPSTDNMIVSGYDVYQDGVKVNITPVGTNAFDVNNLVTGTTYDFTVSAIDFLGNESSQSDTLNVMTNRPPTAAITANPTSGSAPLIVSFNANNSTDPDISLGDYIYGFIWDFGDSTEQEFSNNLQHTFTKAGNYTVTLKVVDHRESWSEPVSINIQVGASGVNEYFSGHTTIYPNPAHDRVTIKGNQINSIHIFNGTGTLVLEKSALNTNEISVGISDLNAGIYFLQIQTATSERFEKLLVK
jgi:PKD repeat protein